MSFQVGIVVNNLKMGLREGCRKAAEIGVDSVQPHFEHEDVNLLALDSRARKDEAKRIRDLGLAISGVCILDRPGEWDTADKMRESLFSWIRLARDLGTPVIQTRFPGVNRGDTCPLGPVQRPPFNVVEAMKPAVDSAASEGIVFAHETGLEPPEDVAAFVDEFDSPGIGVNYDPANLYAFGFDWFAGVEIIGSRIVHVHAKDSCRDGTGDFGFHETRLGEGQVDYDQFLAALRRAGFAGCLALEREGATDPVADMAAAVAFLREKIRNLDLHSERGGR